MTATPATWFERAYAEAEDPWGFEHRPEEHRRYDLTLASLPRPRYRSAVEPACSVGVLTERLAARCDRLVAADLAAAAAATARRRVDHLPHVRVEVGALPAWWPEGPLDLVVLSEVGYYLEAGPWRAALDRAAASLEPGGHLVAVHWRGTSGDHCRPGDDVQADVLATAGLGVVVAHEEPGVWLHVLERR